MEKQLHERWKRLYHPQIMFQPFAFRREMTVTGNGEIAAQPDYVQIQIEVRTEGKNVRAAQQENAMMMNQVIGALVALIIPREDIQTTVYTISPNYDYIEGRQIFRAYEVQNAITVKITDINQAGTVIDTAIQNGANQVSGIHFKIDDSNTYYRQALQLALLDAQAKAKSIANTMHLSLQPLPAEIIEETNVPPVLYREVQLSNQQSVTPIEPGMMTVNATVRVKFWF